MFDTLKQRLLLAMFILLIFSIPVGAYLVSQNQTIKSTASESRPKDDQPLAEKSKTPVTSPKPSSSPKTLLIPEETPEPSTTIASSFGPTLSLKAKLEGRPEANQLASLFVGIMEGVLTANPKFLLSFTIDLPANGSYGNLSLAGLNPGSSYTALLKGSAQIATSSAFVMSPTVTNLNSGQALTMLTGDLNDDNVINSADYSIAQKAFGEDGNADLNKDGVVNTLDLSIIIKNFGAVGASGAWTSPLPQNANQGGPTGSGGYWIWVPK